MTTAKKPNPHIGSTLDAFLEGEGMREALEARVVMEPRYRDALEEPGEEPEDFDLPSPDPEPVGDLGPLPDEPYRASEAPPPAWDADDDVSF